MPFSASLNFRSSAGYVTDSAGQTYCGGQTFDVGETYPISRAGLTFGWVPGHASTVLDRNSGSPFAPEFAGIHHGIDRSGGHEFRLDLPAPGTYAVRLALGDTFSYGATAHCTIRDGPGGAVLATVAAGTSYLSDHYLDATGVSRAGAADWRANNAAAMVTTTGSSLVIRLGDATDGEGFMIAHLEVADAGPPVLAAGTAALVPASIAVSSAAATGGTAPYTYQWQRRTSGGGSYSNLSNGGGVSGTTTLDLTDGSAVVGVLYDYRLVVTDSSATPATATSNAITAQVYTGGAIGSVGVLLVGVG